MPEVEFTKFTQRQEPRTLRGMGLLNRDQGDIADAPRHDWLNFEKPTDPNANEENKSEEDLDGGD